MLDDLIESGRVPVVRLTEIFRQAARSLIVRAAHAVNAGQPPPTAAGPGDLRDFFVIERTGPDAIRDEVVALASQRLPAHYDLDPRAEVLVVAPMHRGPAGHRRAQRRAARAPERRRRRRSRARRCASSIGSSRARTTTSAN